MSKSRLPLSKIFAATATTTLACTAAVAAPAPIPAIVGGEFTQEQLPWITTLLNSHGHASCGGALIHPQWVVTAGHCIEPNVNFSNPDSVRIGALDKTTGGTVVKVTQIVRHTHFATEGTPAARYGRYDIGLLKLERPVSNTPLPLATHRASAGTPVMAFGWGFQDADHTKRTDQLKQLATTVRAHQDCSSRSVLYRDGFELCIDNPDDATGTAQGMCNGDSGSPLVHTVNGRYELAGIVSRETTLRCADGPVVFSDPVAFRHWLSQTTGGDIPALDSTPLPEPTLPPIPSMSWGLDRIDAVGEHKYDQSYTPVGRAGQGVNVYVLDTGVSPHPEFGDRLKPGYDAYDDDADPSDCDGHGTHVAGTIAGTQYGVAPQANIIPIKMTGCKNAAGAAASSAAASSAAEESTMFGRATDWILNNLQTPAVVNMSFELSKRESARTNMRRLLDAGVVVVTAAGNSRNDACEVFPGNMTEVINVAGTDRFDTRGPYSAWGTCVDLFAPGSEIVSANYQGGFMYDTGTSMAAPHVAGAVASYISNTGITDRDKIKAALLAGAAQDQVKGTKGSPNLLLNTGFIPTHQDTAPTATPTSTALPTSPQQPGLTPTTPAPTTHPTAQTGSDQPHRWLTWPWQWPVKWPWTR